MTKRSLRTAAAAVLAAALMPAAWAETAPTCPTGTDPFAEYRLFFGRNKGSSEVVSDAAWRSFLAEEITPRFADGLTVLDATGQWRGASGRIARERTKVVVILAPPGGDALQRTDQIIATYKRTFGQESVLRVVTSACVSF